MDRLVHIISRICTVIISTFVLACVESTATDEAADLETTLAKFSLVEGGKVAYHSNHILGDSSYDVSRAVIMIHGTNRNASEYFDTALAAAELAGKAVQTIIIAPHFKADVDVTDTDELQWSTGGWKVGSLSLEKAGLTRVSSYSVIDQFIEKLTDATIFPYLQDIVIAGHSAGGQFTQRYAAGTEADLDKHAYNFKYVVANPGSYMYLNENRLVNSQFSVPDTTCAYNEYKYGMQARYTYLNSVSDADLLANYPSRRVIYLLGDQDTIVDENLDMGCEAVLQGANRYARGINFMDFMDTYFPSHNHARVDVFDVGHSKSGMFKSTNGLDALFN